MAKFTVLFSIYFLFGMVKTIIGRDAVHTCNALVASHSTPEWVGHVYIVSFTLSERSQTLMYWGGQCNAHTNT